MPRYVAFLRGVMPQLVKMPQLKRCFESAGFKNVKTVLGSGNVVFDAPAAASISVIEKKAESQMEKQLDRVYYTIVRPVEVLDKLIVSDPFAAFQLPEDAKPIVSFLRQPPKPAPKLPIEADGARILAAKGCEVFSAYTPTPEGPVFMELIKKTLGPNVTTRTWETVKKCARE